MPKSEKPLFAHYHFVTLDVLNGANQAVAICTGKHLGSKPHKIINTISTQMSDAGIPGVCYRAKFSDRPMDWSVIIIRNQQLFEQAFSKEEITFGSLRALKDKGTLSAQEDGGCSVAFNKRKDALLFAEALRALQMVPEDIPCIKGVQNTDGKKQKGQEYAAYQVTIPAAYIARFNMFFSPSNKTTVSEEGTHGLPSLRGHVRTTPPEQDGGQKRLF